MTTNFSRSTFVLIFAATIASLACTEAKAQGLIRGLFDGGTYQTEEEVLALYDSNAQRPLGGLFAPGFTRTFTVLGGLNFPSASVTDPDIDSGLDVIPLEAAIATIGDDIFDGDVIIDPITDQTVDGTGYAISFAFGRRHNRRLRSEIEVAFRSNDINTIVGGNGNGSLDSPGTEVVDGSINATSLMKNYIFDFNNGSRFTPYVGIGTGISYVDVEFGEASSPDGEIFQDGDDVFTYQAIAGIATQLTAAADLLVEYRFLGTEDVVLDGFGETFIYNTSTLFFGMKLEY